ncbi:acetylxylan esterase [uncultured Draconibacterium sp.]|uniref:glucuronyl esterase domain-containing protein n=1 Tax=uncultured Draconibacterium sp. TaxID=1573823 RepID=UPI002AA65691|nr:acetylxylan esterase [uncultured Draconibacterium sp.]
MNKLILFFFFFTLMSGASAQFQAIENEDDVPEYKLPDPLKAFNGKNIRNTKKWESKRRPELLKFFTQNMYGEIPGTLEISSVELLEKSASALNGAAERKQVDLYFKNSGKTLHFTVLMYLPKTAGKKPIFLGYNFLGNHTITDDVNIVISSAWAPDNPSYGIINNQLTEQSRGVGSDRWPVEKIIDAGFGLATIYYGEVDPDIDDFSNGIHPLLYVDDQQQPADNEWGAITAWAWGLSRTMDYFETDDSIDESKVIVLGHSRLGKTALWAGARDQRFAAVISNNSGCGGAALSKRRFGETIWRINRSFPHWFCKNFKYYSKNEEKLPVDQHELIALIAPRPVYIASAEEDLWADPKGEFLSAMYASPVYKLYGKEGIDLTEMPALNQPIQNTVAYHIRTGKHNITDFDWDQYLKWATKYVK